MTYHGQGTNDPCMVRWCRKTNWKRGLCPGHHNYWYRRVKKGETTWDDLMAEGKCAPAQRTRGIRKELREKYKRMKEFL